MTRKQSIRAKKKSQAHNTRGGIHIATGKVGDENKQPHNNTESEQTQRSSGKFTKTVGQQGFSSQNVLKTPSRSTSTEHDPTYGIPSQEHQQPNYTSFHSAPLQSNSYYSNHSYTRNNHANTNIPSTYSNNRHSKHSMSSNMLPQLSAIHIGNEQSSRPSAFSKYSGNSNYQNHAKALFGNRSRNRRSSRNRRWPRGDGGGQRSQTSHQQSHPQAAQPAKRRASSDPEPASDEEASIGRDGAERSRTPPSGVSRDRLVRASSPTPSTWSLSTTATFKNDLRDSQFQDMVETFRENDLNNMEKSQILQEYRFMERVNSFLEDKIERVPIPRNLAKLLRRKKRKTEQEEKQAASCETVPKEQTTAGGGGGPDILPASSGQASEGEEKDTSHSDEVQERTLRARLSSTSSAGSSAHSGQKLGVGLESRLGNHGELADRYHHGRYEIDETVKHQLLNEHDMFTAEQQTTLSCLSALGVDPINSISSIREHLDLIEMQVSERHRQLADEKESLILKLGELTSSFEGVRGNAGSPST